MPNRLIHENSPYLLQHAQNPVEWYPWGDEALTAAREAAKPIFLSIGYAACHWCHVMAHESFEDPEIAVLMNRYFINIKVDREERPDIDSIYMNAVVSLTGQGGWPLSVFLTPGGEPFFGGTYFPPDRRFRMPSFREVLTSVKETWEKDRDHILISGQQISDQLRRTAVLGDTSQDLQPELPENAALTLAQSYDWKFGGWGAAPKFPQPMAIEFLLRRAALGDRLGLEIATHALSQMAKGGMYDVVGGGFARYSTDNEWRVPHFEKMLYDNALLSQAYLHAWLLTREPAFRRVCEETLDFIGRELTHPLGGFYSSLDADSEGEEGKYYLWTPAQVREAIPDTSDQQFILQAYGITEAGNFEGSNILQRKLDDSQLAEQSGIERKAIPHRPTGLHKSLLEYRHGRIPPATDDKVLVSWNALALISFAEAGRYLGRQDYLNMAMRNARFLLDHLLVDRRLYRSWRSDQARHNAYLEDYAGLAQALISLYQSNPDSAWFRSALQLKDEMVDHFSDPSGGFFDTRDDQQDLILRPKDLQDNATPSGNSLAAMALLQLHALTGNQEDWRLAERTLRIVQEALPRYPLAFSNWLCAALLAIEPPAEVAIVGPEQHPRTVEFVSVLWNNYRPQLISARSDLPLPQDAPLLLSNRPMIDGQPTAYVCRNFVCNLPATSPAELSRQLGEGQ